MEKKYQLPKEFATKWVEALRTSTERIHGTSKYYNPESGCYCAMGVGYLANGIGFIFNGQCLDDKTNDPLSDGNSKSELWFELVRLNDSENKSFSQIAEYIEQNVEFI